MLDIKVLRNDFEKTAEKLNRRGKNYNLDAFAEMDIKRRECIRHTEDNKAAQNAVSRQIPILKKEGKDTAAVMDEMKELSEKIKSQEALLKKLDEEMETFMLGIANMPHCSVPDGLTENDNIEIRSHGNPTEFDFTPKPHWDIGTDLKIFDPETAVKIAGSRFIMLRKDGARLQRALISFMLDCHTANGYEEIMPPYVANYASMQGVGQLPDKEGMLYNLSDTDLFLIPTAETPLTNIHRNDFVDPALLPMKFCAYSPCFRKEAGAAGRDTRGLIRVHQFDKVEIFKLAHPDNSYEELEKLTADAEDILQKLGLPYRVVNLCAGDLGFSNAKTYDLELWMPSYNKYVEISSCSNYEDFQARRSGIRFKQDGKTAFVHTLNGSGLAITRLIGAILENYQQADGSVKIPDVLVPYMGGLDRIEIK